MELKKGFCTQKKLLEKSLIEKISVFARVDQSNKSIDISENILKKISEEQKMYLYNIKKYNKYTLQYIIE